ncbi:sedoheptulokinase-like [Saccostrea echinata]|uniref:sedoheptulokinase-like n=1 Tax=Saccostrea echinata TaxID=191078 RepID=UPI002A811E57|nr:sedoheptulokinase-like [Saccostrea echinata]
MPGLYFMGIDLGTTSVKISIALNGKQVASVSQPTKADTKSSVGSAGFEQDVAIILSTVQSCMKELSPETLSSVKKICITGQMHGVVLWCSKHLNKFYIQENNAFNVQHTSRLYTWQDQRCSAEFLTSLPKPCSHLPLSTGHGNATLFWLSRYQPDFLTSFDRAGTIMDFLICVLCGLEFPITSNQLAASWGYFDSSTGCWNKEILGQKSFPFHLLPQVLNPGEKAGTLQFDWFSIKKGTPVLVALGDTQCAVYSVLSNPDEAVLNLGTSCQMAFPEFLETVPTFPESSSPVQFFPYFNNQYLAVAASLNGGNVLSQFVSMLQNWIAAFGCVKSKEDIWKTLLESSPKTNKNENPIKIHPTIFGERHAPSQYGKVSGITASNMDLHSVFNALCKGIIENITRMVSPSYLKQKGVKKLLGTGSVIHKNPIIQREVMTQYGDIDVELGRECDSAFGAALFCEATDSS